VNFSFSLTENARRYPEHLAVVDGGTRLTYEQFNSRVNNLARHLLGGGFGRGAVIAILMYNRAEFLETYFACMRIGAVCVPLNYRLAEDEVRHELDHSGCSAVFTEAAFHDVVGTVLQDLGAMKLVVTTSGQTPDGWRSHDELASPVRPPGLGR
jgi:acyl-CoA synthetase (AMP-forming)/AMP-acid ligase II